jgi:hypothetical protein
MARCDRISDEGRLRGRSLYVVGAPGEYEAEGAERNECPFHSAMLKALKDFTHQISSEHGLSSAPGQDDKRS